MKGVHFSGHRYIGDPMNAIKLYSELGADELLLLDIAATKHKTILSAEFVEKVANECYMPFGVGGGIRTVEEIHRLLGAGAEKVCVNTMAMENLDIVEKSASMFGSQSIVVSIDVKKDFFGRYRIFSNCGQKRTKHDLETLIKRLESSGVGEIFLNSIDRDGVMAGYDEDLVKRISYLTNVPVIACGGAGRLADLQSVILSAGASAAAAGSMFVFHSARRGILINYPTRDALDKLFVAEITKKDS